MGNTETNQLYLGNSWYELQFLLNTRQRDRDGHRCMHCGYAIGLFNDLANDTKYYAGMTADDSRIDGSGGDEEQSRSLTDGHWWTPYSPEGIKMHPALVNAAARFGLAMWSANDWASCGVAPAGAAPGRSTRY
ncbi:MAG TPA: hypothetical protein VEY92_11110 [Pseudoxanthomonas sp.]|nr:hypothetical protein [Pseudoxanthomonas sp.]